MIVRIQAAPRLIVRRRGDQVIRRAREQVVSAQVMGENLAEKPFWIFWQHEGTLRTLPDSVNGR